MRASEHRKIIAITWLFALASSACDKPSGAPPTAASNADETRAEAHQVHDHAAHDHARHLPPTAAALAGESIYHAHTQLTDQDGRALEPGTLRGSLVLATMFYASCTSVCPVLIAKLERIVEALPSEVRAQTQVLLVSLDPKRDDPAQLKRLAERHKIADPSWHFVRTDDAGVREMAALLGIRYRQLPDGEISHSQVIVLLDREGVIQQRLDNAAGDPSDLLAATTKAAHSEPSHAAQAR